MNGSNRLLFVVAVKLRRSLKKGEVSNAFQTTELVGSKIHTTLPHELDLLPSEIEKGLCFLLWYIAINGLKQCENNCNKKFDRILKDIGFRRTQVHSRIYF